MNGTPRAASASATGYTRSSRRLMSSTAPSSRSPSASTRASASRTEPAGPATAAPRPSSSRAREAAIRYSSSTTRRRRPRSASGRGSAMLRSCPARLDRHHDGAAHPVGAELEPRLRAELVRQRVLDQLGAVALPPWQGIPRHRHPALPPLDQHPAPGPLDGPGHHEPTRGPLERAVLDGVGRELVERERQRLGEARRQRDRRALDPHLAGIGAAVAVRLELGLDQGAQVDGLPVRAGEQPLHAAERLEPALELVAEPLERGAGAERLEGDRLHDGEQVAGPVVELGHEHPLLVLHAPEVVDVGHGADPFAPRPVAGVQRPGARLVPAVAAVRPAPDAVLDVVLARGRGLGPAPQRRLPVIRVDRVEPAEPEAVPEAHPGEIYPLRAGPGPRPVRPREEDELGDARRQQPEALLALAQPLLRAVPLGAVAHDLDEPGGAALERHEEAGGPEPRAVLAHVPAIVLGAAVGTGAPPLVLGSARDAVFGREDHVGAAAGDLPFHEAEQALGADIPARDGVVRVRGEDREVGRALDDAPEQLGLADRLRPGRLVWSFTHTRWLLAVRPVTLPLPPNDPFRAEELGASVSVPGGSVGSAPAGPARSSSNDNDQRRATPILHRNMGSSRAGEAAGFVMPSYTGWLVGTSGIRDVGAAFRRRPATSRNS